MPALSSARRTARAAGNSRVLELLTRAGFTGYGLLHLAIAWLILQIALGRHPDAGDQSGALRVLLRQPLGTGLLVAIIIGLIAMAVWQLLDAAVGHLDEHGKHRVFERLTSAGRAVLYAALAWTAWRIVSGTPSSSADQQRTATAGILAHPAGRILITAAGLAVIALGIGMIVYGSRRLFEKRLKVGEMSARVRRLATRLGQLGYVAKGIAFTLVGLLLALSALRDDAARSTGLDGALLALTGYPDGQVALLLIAVGFAAFGVYCFFQSRYRKV